jgi:F-box-like
VDNLNAPMREAGTSTSGVAHRLGDLNLQARSASQNANSNTTTFARPAPDLLSLPNELLLQIIEDTEPNDFWNLAATCRQFRALSAEYVQERNELQRHMLHYPYTPRSSQQQDGGTVVVFQAVGQDHRGLNSVIWDIHQLLTTLSGAAKFTLAIVLKRESRPSERTDAETNEVIRRLNELSSSSGIVNFVLSCAVFRCLPDVDRVLTELQIDEDTDRDAHWVWGWLILLVLCYNVECLSIPQSGARKLVQLMATIVTKTYRNKFATLGGMPYGVWSNLMEIYISPPTTAPLRPGVQALPSLCIPVDYVMQLLFLPNLKNLYVWNVIAQSEDTINAFRDTIESTSFASTLEILEVHNGWIKAEHIQILLRPLRKLRRLTWNFPQPTPGATPEEVFSGDRFYHALIQLRHTLEYLSIGLPPMASSRSNINFLSSLKAFRNLAELRVDASFLFPTDAMVGPRAPPISLRQMLPISIQKLTIWRSWRNYCEFEWEYLFQGLAYAKRMKELPYLSLIRFYGELTPGLQSLRPLRPAIGSIVESLERAGISIELIRYVPREPFLGTASEGNTIVFEQSVTRHLPVGAAT